MLTRRCFALIAVVLAFGATSTAVAHDATPAAMSAPDVHLVLVERADHVSNLDLGDPGASVGDVIVWGPDPLLDADGADTGATTQGTCTAFTASADCILLETIVFPDGSTLELQGVQPGQPIESTRTIVAGSGVYLGAKGTVTVSPSDDLVTWPKTFDIWLDD